MTPIPCPSCKTELPDVATLTLVDWVDPAQDPEGKARLDLILECDVCRVRLNAFVPLQDFVEIDV